MYRFTHGCEALFFVYGGGNYEISRYDVIESKEPLSELIALYILLSERRIIMDNSSFFGKFFPAMLGTMAGCMLISCFGIATVRVCRCIKKNETGNNGTETDTVEVCPDNKAEESGFVKAE